MISIFIPKNTNVVSANTKFQMVIIIIIWQASLPVKWRTAKMAANERCFNDLYFRRN